MAYDIQTTIHHGTCCCSCKEREREKQLCHNTTDIMYRKKNFRHHLPLFLIILDCTILVLLPFVLYRRLCVSSSLSLSLFSRWVERKNVRWSASACVLAQSKPYSLLNSAWFSLPLSPLSLSCEEVCRQGISNLFYDYFFDTLLNRCPWITENRCLTHLMFFIEWFLLFSLH